MSTSMDVCSRVQSTASTQSVIGSFSMMADDGAISAFVESMMYLKRDLFTRIVFPVHPHRSHPSLYTLFGVNRITRTRSGMLGKAFFTFIVLV